MHTPPRLAGHVRAVRLPEPLDALAVLADRPHPFLRLVASRGFRGTPWSFLATDPTEVLRVTRLGGGRALSRHLAPLRRRAVERTGPSIPFAGGWAGILGYEARSGVEDRPAPRRSPLAFPAIWLGHYDAVLAWNHRSGEGFVAGQGPDPRAARRAGDALLARLRAASKTSKGRAPQAVPEAPRPRTTSDGYRRSVARARSAILRGDIFQANVSQRFDARLRGRPVDLFRRLAAAQPAPYMTFVDLGRGRAVLSASPERFLRVVGRVAETDPMKGTRPRGETRVEDRRLRQELEASEKERAELAMIVDLSRNDLARACSAGTVRVAVARRLLRFRRVHQAIAVVKGRLKPDHDRVDLLQAAFPPGSVTGAPKVRAMEIIDDLEGEGRGPYCGATGWLDEAGDMDLAVGIRTILTANHTATYRVGAGITLRSDPEEELQETLAKGRGLFAALAGEEAGQ